MSAIFLDRDGVICHNRADHVKHWNEFEFLPGVFDALRILRGLDLPIFVVTNQAVVNRGLCSAQTVEYIHERMVRTIRTQGGRIDAVYYCPHRPDENCDCRKPEAGLLLQAAKDFKVGLQNSYMIGDAITDIQAGQSVGCEAFLVLTGRGVDQLSQDAHKVERPFEVLFDLQAAANRIREFERRENLAAAHKPFFFVPDGSAAALG
jgi:D-glycero-D-manno-heptose 1,7-bisphosphate phosphatase